MADSNHQMGGGGGAVIQSLRDKEGVSKKIFVSPLGLSLVEIWSWQDWTHVQYAANAD